MKRFCILLLVLTCGSTLARADNVAWIIRAPSAGVKGGGTVQVDLIAVNAHETSQAIDAPDVLSGELGEGKNRTKVELRRVGNPPKFAPAGGFVSVPYELNIPEKTKEGEQILRIKAPLEGMAALHILAESPQSPTTLSATTTIAVIMPKPLAPEPVNKVPTTSASGLTEFVRNKLSPYERMYFLYGTNETPEAKFQISFKYQVFNQQSDLSIAHPWVNGFYFAYTQTSFWDLQAASAPFFDSTYRPEVFWATQDIRLPKFPNIARFDFQTGLQHESNGKSGDDSRTVNSFYIEPIFTLGDKDALFLTFAPKAYVYISSLSDNPDITHYRGYFDLNLIFGQADGFQAALTGRIGDDWDKGSVQLDLSYPLRKLLFNSLDIYLHAQAYSGYGESLLRYNEQGTTFRVGLSLVR